MKPIVFSRHALLQMEERGATQEEVELSIRTGEPEPAKLGRQAFRKNFNFEKIWKGRYYTVKQVMAVEQRKKIVYLLSPSMCFISEETMRISYDPEADALYISFKKGTCPSNYYLPY